MRGTELFSHLERIPHEHFVLHGSPLELHSIAPQQAVFEERRDLNEHGIYATTAVEIALLYALVHEDRGDWGWCGAVRDGKPILKVVVPEGFTPASGYVHVLSRRGFHDIEAFPGLHIAYGDPKTPDEILPIDAEVFEELQRNGLLIVEFYDPALLQE